MAQKCSQAMRSVRAAGVPVTFQTPVRSALLRFAPVTLVWLSHPVGRFGDRAEPRPGGRSSE